MFAEWQKKTQHFGILKEEVTNQFIDNCQYLWVYSEAFNKGNFKLLSTSIESDVYDHIEAFKEKFNNNYINEDVIESIKDSAQDQDQM